ncbi:MAG: hypothetical protein ACXVDB_07745, partial [Tumebacillaceae bacterium]
MSTTFDWYAFADYSGATSPRLQRKHIVLATLAAGAVSVAENVDVSVEHHTRESLLHAVKALLAEATRQGKRVIIGFDHSYSFPIGFVETVNGAKWERWEQLLDLLEQGFGAGGHLPPVQDQPREWADVANRVIGQRIGIASGGPFWGSHFHSQVRDPKFPFAETLLEERRLVEMRCKRMSPIYKIGGAGTVGLQSLYGIGYLAKLRAFCKEYGISLHAWPFDGWELPAEGHVLVEVYPTLFNKGARTDEEDAMSCARWLAEQ